MKIRFLIPLSDTEPFAGTIVFQQWLPSAEVDALIKEEGDYSGRLWIDPECLQWPMAADEVAGFQNIQVAKVHIEIQVKNVSVKLWQFIVDERDRDREIHHGLKPGDEEYAELLEDYRYLGRAALEFVMKVYNRFIDFARVEKCQYWLSNRRFDQNSINQNNIKFGARVEGENGAWVRWTPPWVDRMIVVLDGMPGQRVERYFHPEDWKTAQEYLLKGQNTNSTREFLSNALRIANLGYLRSAVVESTAALEITIDAFCQLPKATNFVGLPVSERVKLQSLKNQFEHLGFRNTLHFLLPLVLPESLMPSNLLESCQQLVDIRNNVVHQGQRNLDQRQIIRLIEDVREACRLLQKLTGP